MVIKNKPTFDPYSLADFEARDAFQSGVRTWRKQRAPCLVVAYIATLPVLLTHLLFESVFFPLLSSAYLIPFTVTVIAPLIARDARGLSSDVKTGLKMMRARFALVTFIALLISSIVAAPSFILLLVSKSAAAAAAGLLLGALLASPLALALPVSVVESVGFFQAVKRSLFLIRGRLIKALGIIFLCIAIASAPAAVRFLNPEWALFTLLVEPVLVSWSAVGLGALYLHLYDH